jgi:murein tripeptide amidase MpaA
MNCSPISSVSRSRREMPGYLTSSAIEACLAWLHGNFPALTQLIRLPEMSVEGRVMRALRIRSAGGGARNGVLLVGGTHARELINPDLLAGLALKLCWAYTNGTGLTFGGKAWSATDIRLAVDGLDIFIAPLINPDGREHVQSPTGYQWWRKNRSVNADGSRGTDLNRNYDFLWHWIIGQTSAFPPSDTYHGKAPFSEPETRNVRWLLDTYPNITCFVDVHSYSELILYPWGDDNSQSTDLTQNFQNPAWDGLRGTPGAGYAEYIPATDRTKFADRGVKVRNAISAVRGRTYVVEPSFDLYGTSGGSSDYTYSRFFRGSGARKVWGYVFETNYVGPGNDWQYGFQPPQADALEVMNEVQSGLIQFMLSCVCVVRELGIARLTIESLDELRRFRDVEMVEKRRGRRLVSVLEEHGDELLVLLGSNKRLWQEAGAVLGDAAELVLRREEKDPPRIDRALVARIGRLMTQLDKRASPDLRQALAALRRDLRSVTGKSAREAIR